MRVFTAIALIILVALAGCADADKENTDPVDTTDGSPDDTGTGGTGNVTQPGDNGSAGSNVTANNTAPVASLVADSVNGTAPLTVNFTLDGSDAEGDNLTWTLVIDGNETANGTSLPAAANFTFAAGNHTVLFTVSDGSLDGVADLAITVEAGDVEAPVDPMAPQDRGWYIYDPATEMCHVKDFVDVQGLGHLYNSPLGGGDWYIAETNDVAGLQVENNHPAAPAGTIPLVGGFAQDIPDCKHGDQVLL